MKIAGKTQVRHEGGPIHPPIASITDALTFRLARLVAVNDRAGSEHFRREFGLKLTEWRVLGLTCALEPASFHEIRKALVMDKGQLSRTVKALVARGLIATAPSDEDARSIVLRSTGAGRALHDEVLAFTSVRNEIVVAPLSADECAEFLRLLGKISAHNEDLAVLSGHLA